MTHTAGTNYKRGAFVGGFEYHAPHSDYDASLLRVDPATSQFITESWPKMPSPLHKFYVTTLDNGAHTISVHVENLEQAVRLFERFDHLTLHPLNVHA